MTKIICAALVLFVISYPYNALTQEAGDGGTDPSQPVEPEPEAPWYFFLPEDNLNNFNLSTIGDGDGGSTLGTTTERRSNLSVNQSLESDKDAKNTEDTDSTPLEEQSSVIYPELRSGSAQSPPREGNTKVFRWTDENGVLHVTDDLGSVPKEYQQNFAEEREKGDQ